jgi:pimeloyl-ACP methyl ester carboxylesterase
LSKDWNPSKDSVTVVDNRGTGRSSAPEGPYFIEQMAGDIAGLTGKLGLGRVNVLGISMGGRIALSLALTRPDLVDRLILVTTARNRAIDRLRRDRVLAAKLRLLENTPLPVTEAAVNESEPAVEAAKPSIRPAISWLTSWSRCSRSPCCRRPRST